MSGTGHEITNEGEPVEGGDRQFAWRTLSRRWMNGSLIVRRNFDGHIVSMQQSGSHWIKNLLAHVLIRLHDLPPMAHIQDDSIIGHTRSLPVYKNIPQIVHSHGYPHGLTLKVPFLHYPKYLVLVREMRDSLVSHYERFKGDYDNCPFSVYLRGDLQQKRFYSDIWTRLRFMNEWGRLAAERPDSVRVLRYEDLRDDARGSLRQACDYFGITGVTDEVLDYAVSSSTKEKMAKKPNPAQPTTVVRLVENAPLESYFPPEDQAFFEAMCRRYLKHDFGYGYPVVNKEKAA